MSHFRFPKRLLEWKKLSMALLFLEGPEYRRGPRNMNSTIPASTPLRNEGRNRLRADRVILVSTLLLCAVVCVVLALKKAHQVGPESAETVDSLIRELHVPEVKGYYLFRISPVGPIFALTI